jgi:hypothetical protein
MKQRVKQYKNIFLYVQHGEEAAALGKELALILDRIGACRSSYCLTFSGIFPVFRSRWSCNFLVEPEPKFFGLALASGM